MIAEERRNLCGRHAKHKISYDVRWRFVELWSVRASSSSSWRWLSRGRKEKAGDVNYKALIGNSFLHSVSLYPSSVKRTGEGDIKRIEGEHREYRDTQVHCSSLLFSLFQLSDRPFIFMLFHPPRCTVYIFFSNHASTFCNFSGGE